MGSVLDRLPPESAVAVVRLRSLGDCVLTTPALQILQRARPDLRIAVVVEDRFREIFEPFQTLAPELGLFRKFRPRLVLNLHGGTRSTILTALSGAPLRAGFAHFRRQFVYNIHIPRAQEILGVERKVHTAEHLASAIFYLGAPIVDVPVAQVSNLRKANQFFPTPDAVIHPTAAAPEKTWPAENFLAVADYLQSTGLTPIFIGAASDELTPFAAYRTIQGAPLSEIKSLLAAASLFFGNDSGPGHMAAAFGLPVVVLFGASDPEIWGPWRTPSQVLTGPGIRSITAAQALDALARLRVHA